MLSQIEKMRRPDGSLPPPPDTTEEDPRLGLQMLSLLPNSAARTADPNRDPTSRLSYATAMRQIHTGEIPGLYTFTVEEGLRMEEAERAMQEAAKMQEMSEREEAKRAAKVLREYDEGCGEEDAEERRKLIMMDEYREMHKRGSGNRKNRN